MADSKQGGEIHIESWSFGSANAANATAGELKAPPSGEDARGAGPHVKVFDGASGSAGDSRPEDVAAPSPPPQEAGYLKVGDIKGQATDSDHKSGDDHEIEYDLVTGQVAGPGEPESIGSANGGVWKTTNFDTGSEGADEGSAPSISEIVVTKNSDSSTVLHGHLKVDDIDGESAAGGGKMHLEDITAAPAEPEPGVEIFFKLPEVNGEADGATGGGGAGKVAVHDISIMDEESGPSSFAALEPDSDPAAYLEHRMQNVKVTSYSVNGSGLDASDDDGPSSMAALTPDDAAERSGEQTYLAIKLENVQITSYSLNSDETQDDFAGGTEHEDSWEDVL